VGGYAVAEIAFALLFKVGLPATTFRVLGYWDEALIGALVIAAVRNRRRVPASPDAIDVLGVAFFLLVTLYWRFPGVFPPDPIEVVSDAREVAFRGLVAPVVALLAVRHTDLDPQWRRRTVIAACVTGVVLAVGAIPEVLAPGWWNRFAGFTIGMVPYRQAVFGSTRTSMLAFADFQSSQLQRAGSWYSDPLTVGFAYHLPLAAALVMAVVRPRLAWLLALGFAATGLLLTQGRAAMLGGVVILAAVFRRSDRAATVNRSRLGLAVLAVGLVALPLLAASSLGQRVAGAVNGDDDISAPDHIEASQEALGEVRDNPLGQGLGLSGGNSRRFAVEEGIVSENQFLGIGIEVGVLGMALYVLLIGAVARAGWRGAAASGDPWSYAAVTALVGTAIGGLFLHSLESPVVSVPALVAAGMAVAPVPPSRRRPPTAPTVLAAR
jgi:hypothetical protein